MFGAEKIMVLRVLVINSSEMIPAAVPFTKGFSSLFVCLFVCLSVLQFFRKRLYIRSRNFASKLHM